MVSSLSSPSKKWLPSWGKALSTTCLKSTPTSSSKNGSFCGQLVIHVLRHFSWQNISKEVCDICSLKNNKSHRSILHCFHIFLIHSFSLPFWQINWTRWKVEFEINILKVGIILAASRHLWRFRAQLKSPDVTNVLTGPSISRRRQDFAKQNNKTCQASPLSCSECCSERENKLWKCKKCFWMQAKHSCECNLFVGNKKLLGFDQGQIWSVTKKAEDFGNIWTSLDNFHCWPQ